MSIHQEMSLTTPKFTDNHSSVIFRVALPLQLRNRKIYCFKSSYIHYKSYSDVLNMFLFIIGREYTYICIKIVSLWSVNRWKREDFTLKQRDNTESFTSSDPIPHVYITATTTVEQYFLLQKYYRH